MAALDDLLKRLDQRLILGEVSEETYKEIKERLVRTDPEELESLKEVPRFCPSCGRAMKDDYFLCSACGRIYCLDCRQGKVPCCTRCRSKHDSLRDFLEVEPPPELMFDEEPPTLDPLEAEENRLIREAAESASQTIARLREEMNRQGYPTNLKEWDDLEMLLIPSGNFIYGSEDGEGTKARHSVYVESFYLSRFPITNAQYEAFMEQTNNEPPYYWKDKRFSDPQRPVVGVPWEDALAFCEWLSKMTGSFYRLPLEIEWEKATRGLDGRPYPWGHEEPSAQYCRLSKDIANTDRVGSHPAGASPFGCEDMMANVWQWCADAVVDEVCQVAGQPGKQNKPLDFRVCRGGSRGHAGDYLKCASRDYPIFRLVPLGFRVARGLGDPACSA